MGRGNCRWRRRASIPRARISCASVTPRWRGVRPATRCCRYRLHIGRLTMAIPRLGHRVQGPPHLVRRLLRQRAAMPGHDPAREAAAQRRLRQPPQRLRGRVQRLVDMAVGIEPELRGQRQEPVEVARPAPAPSPAPAPAPRRARPPAAPARGPRHRDSARPWPGSPPAARSARPTRPAARRTAAS